MPAPHLTDAQRNFLALWNLHVAEIIKIARGIPKTLDAALNDVTYLARIQRLEDPNARSVISVDLAFDAGIEDWLVATTYLRDRSKSVLNPVLGTGQQSLDSRIVPLTSGWSTGRDNGSAA